jgi:hypothetical protein
MGSKLRTSAVSVRIVPIGPALLMEYRRLSILTVSKFYDTVIPNRQHTLGLCGDVLADHGGADVHPLLHLVCARALDNRLDDCLLNDGLEGRGGE